MASVMLAALALTGGAGQAGEGLTGELYVVGSHDSERIERVDFNFDAKISRLRARGKPMICVAPAMSMRA